eukprot:gene21568-26420_t
MDRPPGGPPMTPHALQKALQHRWQTLAARGRQALLLATLVLALALFWWVGLAPALRTLRSTETRQHALDAQWQQMQSLQSQARELQQQTRLSRQEALQALEASVRQRLLGEAPAVAADAALVPGIDQQIRARVQGNLCQLPNPQAQDTVLNGGRLRVQYQSN